MLKTRVKANALTNLTDARYFAAREVEWLGFSLEADSDDYIEPAVMKAIKEWVDGVKIVGEFNQPDLPTINSAIDLLEIDLLQLGSFVDYATLKAASEKLPVIQEVIIDADTSTDFIETILSQHDSLVTHFLFNFSKNQFSWQDIQAGKVISIEQLVDWTEQYSILLELNWSAKNVLPILDAAKPTGICLKGGAEEKVGYKSFDELDDILDEIEELV